MVAVVRYTNADNNGSRAPMGGPTTTV